MQFCMVTGITYPRKYAVSRGLNFHGEVSS